MNINLPLFLASKVTHSALFFSLFHLFFFLCYFTSTLHQKTETKTDRK